MAGVIGSPVTQSRSPLIVNAAFEAAGLDWAFVAFEVAPGQAAAAVNAARVLGLGGLMVTMPHKADVIPALDRLTPAARALGAVNSIGWEDEELVGHNTDGAGLVASLKIDEGIDVAGKRAAVIGAGGAARSIIWALADAGASEVVVINRTASAGAVAAELAGRVGRVGAESDLVAADLVVNATSVGMGATIGADGPVPFDPGVLHEGQVVVDAVYQPVVTPLLSAAAERGARTVDGIGMLVHQAALSLERWTGVAPDLAVMAQAARSPG